MDTEKIKNIILSKTSIDLTIGVIGGLFMIFLMTDPFDLHYAGGFLLLVVMMAVVFSAIIIHVILGVGNENYWDRVYVGFLAFFTMITILRLSQIISKNQAWELNKSDILESTIIILVMGLGTSLLFARMKIKNDSDNRH